MDPTEKLFSFLLLFVGNKYWPSYNILIAKNALGYTMDVNVYCHFALKYFTNPIISINLNRIFNTTKRSKSSA